MAVFYSPILPFLVFWLYRPASRKFALYKGKKLVTAYLSVKETRKTRPLLRLAVKWSLRQRRNVCIQKNSRDSKSENRTIIRHTRGTNNTAFQNLTDIRVYYHHQPGKAAVHACYAHAGWKHSYLQSLIEPTNRNLGPFAQKTSSVRIVLNVDPEDNLKASSNCSKKHEI